MEIVISRELDDDYDGSMRELRTGNAQLFSWDPSLWGVRLQLSITEGDARINFVTVASTALILRPSAARIFEHSSLALESLLRRGRLLTLYHAASICQSSIAISHSR